MNHDELLIQMGSLGSTRSTPLCEKYRPQRIADFIGLEKPKRVLQRFADKPYGCAWLFVGRAGIGKTAMAQALASALAADVHVLPARGCTRENVAYVCSQCEGSPGKRHLILVDQADMLSRQSQTDLRSRLDGVGCLPNAVWVFTATNAEVLDEGFRSRCLQLHFSSYGISKEAATLLEKIWELERPHPEMARPNFARIIKEANNDIRAALMDIEVRLAMGSHADGR